MSLSPNGFSPGLPVQLRVGQKGVALNDDQYFSKNVSVSQVVENALVHISAWNNERDHNKVCILGKVRAGAVERGLVIARVEEGRHEF